MVRGIVFASLIGAIAVSALPDPRERREAADVVSYTTSTESTTVVVISVVTDHTTTTDTAFVTLTDSPCDDDDDTVVAAVSTQSPLPLSNGNDDATTGVDEGKIDGSSGGAGAEQPEIVIETVYEDCETTSGNALTTPAPVPMATGVSSSLSASVGDVAVSSFSPPPQYSAPALQPTVPRDQDTSDLSNLVPSNSSRLVFTPDGISGMLSCHKGIGPHTC